MGVHILPDAASAPGVAPARGRSFSGEHKYLMSMWSQRTLLTAAMFERFALRNEVAQMRTRR
jgi:hypothetical protein